MGSQALGSPAGAAVSADTGSAPAPRPRRRPGPALIAALFAGAWVLPLLTQLTRTDPLVVLLVVFGTGGLLRVGSTVLDRLMATLALLIGLAIVGGLLFSLWPWGLQPLALSWVALNLLVAAYVWLGAAPPWRNWPRRVLGSDLVLLIGLVAGTLVAYWPSIWGGPANRLGFAALTGDRIRDFNLYDTIHQLGGYPFLMQGKAKAALDPGMLTQYPPGQHYIYALADIFLRSNMNPGSTVDEFNRYNVWVSLGYGFFVLCVAWAARWVAGPALKGWRRVFLVTAIAGFLAIGSFSSAIWCTWDPQVFGMGLLALLAAFCFRPPTGMRTHVALMALLFIAICMTYELFAPFAAILIVVSFGIYRKRLLPHWKLILVVAVVTAPAALSEYLSANSAGLNTGTASQATGFTIPVSLLVLVVLGVLSLAGFGTSAARRRPSAVAGLIAVVFSGLAVLVYMFYSNPDNQPLGDIYYFQKFVQAWVVIMLVAIGSAGHLLRRPVLPARGVAGALAGCCAFVLAIGATHSYWWSASLTVQTTDTVNSGVGWSPSASSTWASIWMNKKYIVPANINPLLHLSKKHMLADGVPTLAIIFPDQGSNVNLSLQLAALNRDAGQITTPINAGLSYTDCLVPDKSLCAAGWTAAQDKGLAQLEASIEASPVPLRVIVDSDRLYSSLTAWSAAHPGKITTVLNMPGIRNQ